MADGGGGRAAGLKDQGNEQFKSGNYLKAAALYTRAIKLDSDNPTLYRCPLSLPSHLRSFSARNPTALIDLLGRR